MYSGSINQCYWAGATGYTQCETCTGQGTESTKSPILSCLGQFDIWASLRDAEVWIPHILHPCQPKSRASTQLLPPHRPCQGCSRGQHSSHHTIPPCTKINIIFPALRTGNCCQRGELHGKCAETISCLVHPYSFSKWSQICCWIPYPYPCSSLCQLEKSPPNSAPSCSQHSPPSRNCCSSCHFGFIKTLEPDKQIFVGFFFSGFGVFVCGREIINCSLVFGKKRLSLSAAAGRAGRGSTKTKRDHNQINRTVQKRSLE